MSRQLTFSELIRISRPRFWIYLLGPVFLGLATMSSVDASQLLPWPVWLLMLHFSLPANLLLYGINDIFDYETDLRNTKKEGYEMRVTPDQQKKLAGIIIVLQIPILLAFPFYPSITRWLLVGFYLLAVGYSMPPFRFKALPFIDSLSNVLYALPGFIAFSAVGGSQIPWPVIIAATAWCMAMHAFSAVPDIQPDKEAELRTIATRLGRQPTILFCAGLYALSAILVYPFVGMIASIMGIVYASLMFLALRTKTQDELLRVYRWFPTVNTLVGMGLFFAIVLQGR
ncbi:prenyltransferase [Candidatus Uhrbacteria bacterium]|nr:prenyltransferase [Candidatus Uhrbacteria bacterium]MBD3283846.1 prenyltransferase [Candidatus Uhrbacteria bacterium]